MQEKKQFRTNMIKQLHKISKPQYEQMSYQIALQLYKDVSFTSANHIGITISKFPEVDTYQIIRTAWQLGKKVSIPKCDPATRQMTFRQLEHFNQLESVYSSLFEPIVEETEQTDPAQIDLLLVPGLAYSPKGYRLGFGGGYYDRFLQNYKGKTISLAFSMQLQKEIPKENHDLAVQKIITNEGVLCTDE
ncbi:MAG: 5-formyltetrahydrofolate cyclo-ligase [Niallia nealsonii]|nr:5-formyltetrahydrofolate cyclo-ligase [Niallia nealsonii AAU1]MDU1845194.1 5-formyltetrahydrofolate cyclo-ligase [Niallia nealsonii]